MIKKIAAGIAGASLALAAPAFAAPSAASLSPMAALSTASLSTASLQADGTAGGTWANPQAWVILGGLVIGTVFAVVMINDEEDAVSP